MKTKTLREFKSISERFELSARTDKHTWRHHYEVASIKQLEEVNGKLQLSKMLEAAEKKGMPLYTGFCRL